MEELIKEMESYKQSLEEQCKELSEKIEWVSGYRGRETEIAREFRNLLTSTRDIVNMRIKVWDYKIKNLKRT